jgi:hypothetical protein
LLPHPNNLLTGSGVRPVARACPAATLGPANFFVLPTCPYCLPLQLDKEERLAAEPPKLSKHRFQPMPLQVLTSDELAGSLRRLKPTAMLAKDR